VVLAGCGPLLYLLAVQYLRAVLRTTIVTMVLLGIFYGITRGLGLGIDDIPHIVPDFGQSPEN
jgi:predicted secreted protein